MAASINLPQLLQGIPRGSWVAISEERNQVLAFGADSVEVFERAHNEGEADPLIVRIPEQDLMLCL